MGPKQSYSEVDGGWHMNICKVYTVVPVSLCTLDLPTVPLKYMSGHIGKVGL